LTKEFYENSHTAKKGSDYERTSHNKIRRLLELFDQGDRSYLLDIGCGDGTISSLIQERSGRPVIGVDISLVAAKRAKTKISEVVLADINRPLPFRRDSVEAIFCGSVIEHVFDVDRLMDEILCIMKKNGYCVLTTPNLAWWANRLLVLVGLNPLFSEPSYRFDISGFSKRRRSDVPAGHLHLFATRTLRKLLELYGCRLIAIKGSTIMERHIVNRLETSRTITGRSMSFIARLIDPIAAKFPSVAAEVIVKFSKGEPIKDAI
jgi:SAM-dependent methyltransferase